ncbi:MAG: hypothetical protein U0800_19895 [Isosphaeraceae bacterium]
MVLGIAFAAALARGVWAGMPSITPADIERARSNGLTELTRQRVEVISFFLLVLVLCALAIRWLWNSLRKDFPALPELSVRRALGMIVLWGLLFVIVLTMISGARELMTPGAWEKVGLTQRLVVEPPPIEGEIKARYAALDRLGDRLIQHAQSHNRDFPSIDAFAGFAGPLAEVPKPPGGRYVYVGGRLPSSRSDREVANAPPPHRPTILAYEPDTAGPDRLVLMTDGMIVWLPTAEIERQLAEPER